MSGFISQDTINNVRDSSDIISVIGEYTKLDRKTGNKWWGCCPFHSEKTHLTANRHGFFTKFNFLK